MLHYFNTYIKQNNLCTPNEKILLAVSGGADSVVLLHLFSKLNFSFNLAHCNFNLRGAESDEDELFVKNLCKKYAIDGHFISFNTNEYATENKISIEMAARNLRYNWFNKLSSEFGYTKIATGHHLNDSIETFLINLVRGTGINGLTGIKQKNENIIRPLLFATREQVLNYIKNEKLLFRTDSSNLSNEYVRNIIRNEVIPRLKTINPAFETTMHENLSRLEVVSQIYNAEVNKIKQELVQMRNRQIIIDKLGMLKLKSNENFLFEIISAYGFNFDIAKNIISNLAAKPGKLFYSNTHQLLVDREYIIIEKSKISKAYFIIHSINDFSSAPLLMQAREYNISEYQLNTNKNIACLDAEKLKFPLVLRRWKTGDGFYPLGMKNKKKLSDFFIDLKINRFEKEKTWLLESDNKIVWILGLRIDDRFKITEKTKKVLQITIQ